VPYLPLYNIFGMNIPVFYSFAILAYLVATFFVFFLAIVLTKSKTLSFLSAAVFASGFIGSDGILRLFNSIQTSYSVVLISILFIFLYRYFENKKLSNYLLSVIFFYLSCESAYIRTQYLIFPVVLFILIFFVNWKNIKSICKGVILSVPFILIFQRIFLANPDPRSSVVVDFIRGLLSGHLEYSFGFFGTVGSLVLPDLIRDKAFSLTGRLLINIIDQAAVLEIFGALVTILIINFLLAKRKLGIRLGLFLLEATWLLLQWKFFHHSQLLENRPFDQVTRLVFVNFIGGSFLILCLAILISFFQKSSKKGKLALFLLGWLVFSILAYSTYLPFSPLETINRYLLHTFVAYALFFTFVSFGIFQGFHKVKKVAWILVGCLILFNLGSSVNYQHQFIIRKSRPTSNFYKQLKQELPFIKKKSVIYFDVSDDPKSTQEFRDFVSVSSMPNTTAMAIRYGIDRYDFRMTQNLEEFMSWLKSSNIPESETHSFFYKDGKLTNTSQILRENFSQGNTRQLDLSGFTYTDGVLKGNVQGMISPLIYEGQESTELLNPGIEVNNLNFPSVTPTTIQISIRAALPSYKKFPVRDLTGDYVQGRILDFFKDNDVNCQQKINLYEENLLLKYLISATDFRKNTKVKVSTQEQYQTQDLLIDGKQNTFWRSNRGAWHYNKDEQLILDLGSVKNISQLVWINTLSNSTPTRYKLFISTDGYQWQQVKEVNSPNRKNNNEVIIDSFAPQNARFLKMEIFGTYDTDSPAIGEMEVVQTGFADIDKSLATRIASRPFACIKDLEELNLLTQYLQEENVKFFVVWKTDKSENWQGNSIDSINIKPDGLDHTYYITVPTQGMNIETLRLGPTLAPLNVNIQDISLIHRKLKEF